MVAIVQFFSFAENHNKMINIDQQTDFAPGGSKKTLKYKIYEIIFKSDTPAGKRFDLLLIVCIILSTATVVLESLEFFHTQYSIYFYVLEWILTVLFTIEYVLRIYSIKNPRAYIFSFYGIIDLLAIIPTYLSLVLAGSQYLVTIRVLRVLRIFRILKLNRYLAESRFLIKALQQSRVKITIFISVVFSAVIIIGSVMHFLEGEVNEGFSNIPHSIYWAIVTLTTVGYGDVVPATGIGKFLASVLMMLGYAIIAVPTGIITSEMMNTEKKQEHKYFSKKCNHCNEKEHETDSLYCRKCGSML